MAKTPKEPNPALNAWRKHTEQEARQRPTPSAEQLADAIKRSAQQDSEWGWLGGPVLGEADQAGNKPFDSKAISDIKHQRQKQKSRER